MARLFIRGKSVTKNSALPVVKRHQKSSLFFSLKGYGLAKTSVNPHSPGCILAWRIDTQ